LGAAAQALTTTKAPSNVVADAECITVASGGDRLYQKTLLKFGEGSIEIIARFWST
jgi:hypothetical protein